MPKAEVITDFVWEDASVTLMARIRGNDGNYILQANVSAIKAHAFDVLGSTPDTDVHNASPTVSSVVFDTLQTADPRWAVDTTGYNFLYTLPASVIANESTYRVEIVFTPSTGDKFPVVYSLPVIGLRSS